MDELQRLANGQLTAAEAFDLHRHLVHCPTCSQMVDALKQASRTLTAPTPSVSAVGHPAAPAVVPPPTPTLITGPSTEMQELLAPPEGPDEIGRLANYRVLKLLGAGGMGMVFLAEDLQLQRKSALKVMRPQSSADEDSRKRFLREARLAASLEHENIVTVYQAGEDRSVLYLAMQLLLGENLEDRLMHDRRLPVADVLRVGRETAAGLAIAHERGMVHRDIKPSNLWLETRAGSATSKPAAGKKARAEFRVKILDFGLARDSEGSDKVTKTGFVVGTAGYIAPEQARGRAADARSDIFSLGCVLYEACTGSCPFKGTDAMSRLTALAVENPTPPKTINPNIPDNVSQLVLWMLNKEPDDRPQSARQLIETIEQIEAELADSPPPEASGKTAALRKSGDKTSEAPSASPAPAPASSPAGTIMMFAIVVVFVVLAFLGYQLLK